VSQLHSAHTFALCTKVPLFLTLVSIGVKVDFSQREARVV